MSLSTYHLEYGGHGGHGGRHLARLHRRRRRRAYAPTSNTATHDKHKKITSWVSFSFLYGYEAPLGGPSGRYSSATKIYHVSPNNLLIVGIYLNQVQEQKTRQYVSIGIHHAWLKDS